MREAGVTRRTSPLAGLKVPVREVEDMPMKETNQKYATMEKSRSFEDLRKLRLKALLRDLVREEGRMEAAELLGINYKTLVRAIESDDLSNRMSDALERLLLTGGVPEMARQGERIDDLERGMQGLGGRVDALEQEMRSGFDKVLAAVEGRAGVLREESVQATRRSDRPTASAGGRQPRQGGRATSAEALLSRQGKTGDRPDPLVLTEEPLPDDEEFHGPAWPLIAEWRELRAIHPNQGRGLSWLVDEEHLMEVEVALIEDHGFTLPPEREALRGLARRSQLTWRKRLYSTRGGRVSGGNGGAGYAASSPLGCGGSSSQGAAVRVRHEDRECG